MNTEDQQYTTHQIQYTYLLQAYRLLYQCCFLSRFLSLAAKEKSTSGSEKINQDVHQEKSVHKPMFRQGKCINSTILASGATYDSVTARFNREDPLFGNTNEPPSLHRYLYANVNPTVYIDPTGEAAYLFDGSGQDANDPSTINPSNIGKLRELLDEEVAYRHGVGTNDGIVGSFIGNVTGAGVNYRMNEAYMALVNNFNGIRVDENGNQISVQPDRSIDLFGFSRGAATARIFANKISEKGIPDLSSRREQWVYDTGGKLRKEVVFDNYFKPEIRFMGLFDTVGSFGIAGNANEVGFDLSISPNVKKVYHAVAGDEMRDGFPSSSAIDPTNVHDSRIIERIFEGVHSDIGGSYSDDDSLANDALYWMYQGAKFSGVPLKNYPGKWLPIDPASVQKPPKYSTVNQAYAAVLKGENYDPYAKATQGNRTIHDSRYWRSNTPRKVIFRSNRRPDSSDVPEWPFDPVIITMPQYEEFMRLAYDKPYWNVTEDYKEP